MIVLGNPRCVTNLYCEWQELKPKAETKSSFLVLYFPSGVHTVKTVGSHLNMAAEANFSEEILLLNKFSQPSLYVSTTDLVTVYVTLVRPLLEYGCIVWHFSLPLCLSDRLESIQKRALRIILPHYSSTSALEALNLPSLLLRRECLCCKSFSKLTSLANPVSYPAPSSAP